ncbi:unnamed protein product [Bursaphelenchus xylophilus]|uniref:(pine wood nematode) hypothetical protein n=1 Tax=Bursaphelenchus xylophilus TaxID=6326 RepID=A0A7I8WS82_BURXY|nr:unnamed protein product [Bursaphelenchus xylophilus]CAG9115165.1 unnamed protein product [Bursaphelenchus xylophilus]
MSQTAPGICRKNANRKQKIVHAFPLFIELLFSLSKMEEVKPKEEVVVSDPEMDDDDVGSDFSVLDERDENLEPEREDVDYRDLTSHTVSEYHMSEDGSVKAGAEALIKSDPFPLPQFLTLSQFVNENSTEQAMKRLLEEYKVNQTVLDQVLNTVMEIKTAKKVENEEEMQCLKEQNEDLKKLVQQKEEKVNELEALVADHVKNSTSTLATLTTHMDKFNSLAESLHSLKMSGSGSQIEAPESLNSLNLPSAPPFDSSTSTNPYQHAQEQLRRLEELDDIKSMNSSMLSTQTAQGFEPNDLQNERDELARYYEEQCSLNVELKKMLDLKVEEISELKRQLRKKEEEVETQKTIVRVLEEERNDQQVDIDPMVVDYQNQIKSLETVLQDYHDRNETKTPRRRRHHPCFRPITRQPVSSNGNPSSNFFAQIDQSIAQSLSKVNEHLDRVRAQHLNRINNTQMFVCQCMHAFPSHGQLVAHRASCPNNLD